MMKCKNIGIIASVRAEMEVFNGLVKNHGWGDINIHMAVGGVGKSAAAATSQKLISENKADILIYIGLAGALDPELKIGDMAIVSSVIDAEMDARAFDKSLFLGEYPFTRDRVFLTNEKLVELALSAPVDIHKFDGFVATTSTFMDVETKKRFNKDKLYQLEAEVNGKQRVPNLIDMESIGFLTAANMNNTPCLMHRAISNTLEGDAAADYIDALFSNVKEYFLIVEHIVKNLNQEA